MTSARKATSAAAASRRRARPDDRSASDRCRPARRPGARSGSGRSCATTTIRSAINNQGSVMAYRQNYLDLDPTYRDRYGRPLMRMTFDFQQNEQKQANCIADICVKIGQAMGAERVVRRASAAALQHRALSEHSQHRRGRVRDRSDDQRAQSFFPVLGRAERFRHRRMRFPPERRQEPDRSGRRARLLGRRCHQALPEESGSARAGVNWDGLQAWIGPDTMSLAISMRERGHARSTRCRLRPSSPRPSDSISSTNRRSPTSRSPICTGG